MAQTQYLTASGLDKFKEELEDLKKAKRPAVIKRIQKAKELGDLSENAEYADAKEQQSFIEGRIIELEEIIGNSSIIDNGSNNGDSVQIGSTVQANLGGTDMTYQIVGSNEADPANHKISNESPLGQALLDKRIGDKFAFASPRGDITVEITSVS
ncbi:transcription elongation factor GreA [bacterium]|nr:transcription elongation factor GreA [bacterium]